MQPQKKGGKKKDILNVRDLSKSTLFESSMSSENSGIIKSLSLPHKTAPWMPVVSLMASIFL